MATLVAPLVIALTLSSAADATALRPLHGFTDVRLDPALLAEHGLRVSLPGAAPADQYRLTIAAEGLEPISWTDRGELFPPIVAPIHHHEPLLVAGRLAEVQARVVISDASRPGPRRPAEPGVFALRAADGVFDRSSADLIIDAGALVISPEMAAALGEPSLAGIVVGHAVSRLRTSPPPVAAGVTPRDVACGSGTGPDVIVGVLGITNYAADSGIEAFSIGTTACNMGSANVLWQAGTNRHPVVAQTMYRLQERDGASRFEMIGLSWMKHTFVVVAENDCSCGCGAAGGSVLPVGCSDIYVPSTNGDQNGNTSGMTWLNGGLGPRFQVNAHSGVFTYPYEFRGLAGNSIYKRLQVLETDIDPADDGGGQYFIAAQYITQDDSKNLNQNNNESYRPVDFIGGDGAWSALVNAVPTQRGDAAIRAWADNDLPPNNVVETDIDTPEVVPGDQPLNTTGLVILAAEATDLGGGQWHYEYAIENLNSDRSIGSFSVPVAANAAVTHIGFHDVFYHSGDGHGSTVGSPVTYDGTDWPGSFDGGAVSWAYVPTMPVENSNALRFNTTYTFRFDCNAPPTTGTATLGLFKTSMSLANSVTGQTVAPCVGPALAAMADDAALCGTAYLSAAPSVQGTGTMTWSLVAGPPGAMIDSNTGIVSWPAAVASSTPYTVTIQAASGCSAATHQVSWLLTVAFGDFDGDGLVLLSDIVPFTDHLLGLSATTPCAADMNEDGFINGDDMPLFIDALP